MADPKQVYRATDCSPSALYAKRSASSDDVYPILVNTDGILLAGSELSIPPFDFIDWSDLTAITYKRGGSGGTVVATLSLVGSTLTKT
jgi:hypothetical protein